MNEEFKVLDVSVLAHQRVICKHYRIAFPVKDKWREVGVLTKRRPSGVEELVQEVITDADSFVLTLEDTEVDTEALLSIFATVILLDYLLYENGGLCEGTTHGCMSCQLCNVYLCGYVGLWRCYF